MNRMEQTNQKDLICINCGNEYFFVLYDLSIGHGEQDTQFELLKCMDCGTLKNTQFDKTRE